MDASPTPQSSPSATSRAALLVVDVQRDFCPGGALPAPGCLRIIAPLNAYLARARALGMPVYASRDWHPAVTTHFKAYGGPWPPHCVQGTEGAEFHPSLELPGDTIVVSKGDDPERPGYSAFEGRTPDGRSLADDLRRRGIAHLYVAGLTTDYCVRQTVLDGLAAGLHVTVLTDAVAAIDARPGDGERALAEMSAKGAALAAGADCLTA
jgi:nicotinamidase/pyrazinamidase